MFAPKVAKAQTKAAANLANSLAHQRSMLVAHRPDHSKVEQMLMLQRTIGNQAMLRLLLQRAESPTGGELSDQHEQNAKGFAREAPVASWDFSKIPIFTPDRANRPQTSSPLTALPLPGIIQPKLAVGQVNDPLEHEADRVAEQVIRMPAPGFPIAASPQLSRKYVAFE